MTFDFYVIIQPSHLIENTFNIEIKINAIFLTISFIETVNPAGSDWYGGLYFGDVLLLLKLLKLSGINHVLGMFNQGL